MVRIRLRFFALFKELAGKDSFVLRVGEGVKLEDLRKEIEKTIPGLRNHPAIIAVNGEYKEPDYVLRDGDEISILPLFSGG